ncbi:hypothetical protein [Burkholderia arboris]|uniref:hypothetical protein n=1 Tax=Burkholderia arboris TaxID=488730 RepID=UPI001CF5D17A|nr:hypothetical protein [Burkholderia arboris]MCA8051310.1 hypothetical protein [Burkholderia arboris]
MGQSTKGTAAPVILDIAALDGVFDPTALDRSDEDLGRYLWDVYLGAWRKETHCYAPIEAIAEQLRRLATVLEADNPTNNSVEKAIHKAALGEFSVAGRSIRHHIMDNGAKIKAAPLVARGIAAEKKSKSFRGKGIDAQKKVGEDNRVTVRNSATALMEQRTRPYDSTNQLVQDIVRKTGLGKTVIREHLEALGMTIKK